MRRRFLLNYLLLVGMPLLALVVLLGVGEHRFAGVMHRPGAFPGSGSTGTGAFRVLTLILQITTILIVARICGALFRRVGQPQVVGEMAAGVLLGPSVFGAVAPRVFVYVFPVQSLDYLNALSQVGLLIFMFLIGLEMDARLLRGSTRTALLTSHTSMVLPFLLGVVVSVFFFEVAPPPGAVRFTGYALFMGIAMSITAFPVLARIIQERQLTQTKLGALALASAAIGDVTGWCVLALVVIIARSGQVGREFWITIVGSALFVAFMLFVVRPVARRFLERRSRMVHALSQDVVAALLICALVSAFVTERLGIHALFGAFLAGAILPAHYAPVRDLIRRLEDLTVIFLLPLFFAFTGLRTQIGLLDSGEAWLKTGAIVAVAVIGKLGGSAVAARMSGMSWRDAGAVGALMNTRGLMELVVLNIGLDIGVIPPALFAMMVLMALATTLMTTPLLQLFQARSLRKRGGEETAREDHTRW